MSEIYRTNPDMQEQNKTFYDFVARTDSLAAYLSVNLEELPAKIGISRGMFYAYRSGKSPISNKAWRKLEVVEQSAGIKKPSSHAAVSLRPELHEEASEDHPVYMPSMASVDSPGQLASFLRAEALHHLEMARKLNAAADLLDRNQ